MDAPGRSLLRLAGLALFVFLVIAFTGFILIKLGAAPSLILLAGPSASPDDQILLATEYGLTQPAVVQFIRFTIRILGLEFGKSWFTGEDVFDEMFARLPATIELMLYALMLGVLIGVPAGIAAAFGHHRAEDRTVRFAGLVGEAMPAFLLGLLLLFVFFRVLDIAPAPSGRISVVLSPPPPVTGSFFLDAVLVQDSIAARSALAQLILPVVTLALLIAASLALQVRAAMLAQIQTPHFAYARAQGMSRDMLTGIALRGAGPSIGGSLSHQIAALLGTTAVVEQVFSWGGIGQYGLDAMARADFAVVQGFVVLCALFAMLIHLIHRLVRMAIRLRIRPV
jgi:ABC-type dipeptide/oligopeptide/nickel transport system permease component